MVEMVNFRSVAASSEDEVFLEISGRSVEYGGSKIEVATMEMQ